MPPPIPLSQCLRIRTVIPKCTSCRRAFSFSTPPHAQTSPAAQRRKHRDPYALAQAQAKKAANLSRQEVLKGERAAALGDPVRGVPTPFVESFASALPPDPPADDGPMQNAPISVPDSSSANPGTENEEHMNFYLSKSELEAGLEEARWLDTRPRGVAENDDFTTDIKPAEREELHRQHQDTAAEALRRIANLSLGNSKDRMRVNTQRCIDTFGRHNTDRSLPPKPPSQQALTSTSIPEKEQRAGADTGSSEVQIAILTAKIKTLADFLGTRGTMDKANKRNLRLLVHRRQKLLQYLRRKERGGPRWQHCIETLGLTEGTWRGEISL